MPENCTDTAPPACLDTSYDHLRVRELIDHIRHDPQNTELHKALAKKAWEGQVSVQ